MTDEYDRIWHPRSGPPVDALVNRAVRSRADADRMPRLSPASHSWRVGLAEPGEWVCSTLVVLVDLDLAGWPSMVRCSRLSGAALVGLVGEPGEVSCPVLALVRA